MDYRRRANSAASKGLLSKQLASITDTLAKASQRRDAELKKARWSTRTSPVTEGPAYVSEPAVPVKNLDQTRLKSAAAQLDVTAATASDLHASKNTAKGTANSDAPAASMRAYDTSHIGDDPRAMLAELKSLKDAAYTSDSRSNDESADDVGRMLAELDRSASPPLTAAVAPTDDDPQQMLTELAALSTTGRREVSSYTNEDDDDDDGDINILRMRLQNLRSHFDMPPQKVPGSRTHLGKAVGHRAQDKTLEGSGACIDPEVMPYVIALELEHSRIQWEHAHGWTTYLYSSGLNSYEAHKDKEIAVAHAEEALQKIISSVLEVEEDFRYKEEETKLQKRLVVSNLAAGADVPELERLFRKHRFDIVNIALLPDRDPLKRTQTAHIDMSSRGAVIQASYMTGQIYGLIIHVELAVEQDG